MDYNKLINSSDYDFLRTNPKLKDNVMILALGGSRAYGTNNENSDVDIRGCALNSKSDLLGFGKFEQVVDIPTDTTIYSFNKLVSLLINMNPNVIELLGCKPEHYLYLSKEGRDLINNKGLFLSQRCIGSFGGYAGQQLNRMRNKLLKGERNEIQESEQLRESLNSMAYTFQSRYTEFENGSITFDIDKSNNELYSNINLTNYPLKDFSGILSEIQNLAKVYGKLNNRNTRNTHEGINKHAMHLIRLYMMELDLLEKCEIVTYRENDIELLMQIRNGHYMDNNGNYNNEFYELIEYYKIRVDYAIKNTNLPEKPDLTKIEEYVMDVNRSIITNA